MVKNWFERFLLSSEHVSVSYHGMKDVFKIDKNNNVALGVSLLLILNTEIQEAVLQFDWLFETNGKT